MLMRSTLGRIVTLSVVGATLVVAWRDRCRARRRRGRPGGHHVDVVDHHDDRRVDHHDVHLVHHARRHHDHQHQTSTTTTTTTKPPAPLVDRAAAAARRGSRRAAAPPRRSPTRCRRPRPRRPPRPRCPICRSSRPTPARAVASSTRSRGCGSGPSRATARCPRPTSSRVAAPGTSRCRAPTASSPGRATRATSTIPHICWRFMVRFTKGPGRRQHRVPRDPDQHQDRLQAAVAEPARPGPLRRLRPPGARGRGLHVGLGADRHQGRRPRLTRHAAAPIRAPARRYADVRHGHPHVTSHLAATAHVRRGHPRVAGLFRDRSGPRRRPVGAVAAPTRRHRTGRPGALANAIGRRPRPSCCRAPRRRCPVARDPGATTTSLVLAEPDCRELPRRRRRQRRLQRPDRDR